VHLEAHLLNCIRDDRPSEGEVLESPGQVVVSSQVTDWGTHVRGDLGLSVDRYGAVAHDSVLKDIPSVLALVKEEAIRSLLH
jgi:hypothetical protein